MKRERIMSILLAVAIFFAVTGVYQTATPNGLRASTGSFSDIPGSFWAADAIEKAVKAGITNGYSDGSFRPNSLVTNAQLVAFMTRAFYLEEAASVPIASGKAWHYATTSTAYKLGLLDGTAMASDSASEWTRTGNAPATRYDMAMLMYNVLKEKGTAMPNYKELSAAAKNIGDWDGIPISYRNAVCYCYALGLLQGTDGRFNGASTTNRAQACVIIGRLKEYLGSERSVDAYTPGNTWELPWLSEDFHTVDYKNTDGFLANGKPITVENVLEIVEQLKKSYPEGTLYQRVGDFYGSEAIPTPGRGGDGCDGLAKFFSDAIFGGRNGRTNAPYVLEDHTQIRPGDIIEVHGVDGNISHYEIAISQRYSEDYSWGSISRYDTAGAGRGVNIISFSSMTEDFKTQYNNGYWVVFSRYPK
ncbi:MAG: S-layer homology domain-containing protein [Lachnospiraceae bacterium]|nr:S-layer homology domain-containing protein [Lachnospiraceae bacterium]